MNIPGTYDADAEFWLARVAGTGRRSGVRASATAPVSGTITAVRLKVGDDSESVPIRFSVVEARGGGRTRVLTTSTPAFNLPAHTPGIQTFDFKHLRYRMPINKGDYLTLDTPGVKPSSTFLVRVGRGIDIGRIYESRPDAEPRVCSRRDPTPTH